MGVRHVRGTVACARSQEEDTHKRAKVRVSGVQRHLAAVLHVERLARLDVDREDDEDGHHRPRVTGGAGDGGGVERGDGEAIDGEEALADVGVLRLVVEEANGRTELHRLLIRAELEPAAAFDEDVPRVELEAVDGRVPAQRATDCQAAHLPAVGFDLASAKGCDAVTL